MGPSSAPIMSRSAWLNAIPDRPCTELKHAKDITERTVPVFQDGRSGTEPMLRWIENASRATPQPDRHSVAIMIERMLRVFIASTTAAAIVINRITEVIWTAGR